MEMLWRYKVWDNDIIYIYNNDPYIPIEYMKLWLCRKKNTENDDQQVELYRDSSFSP